MGALAAHLAVFVSLGYNDENWLGDRKISAGTEGVE